MKLPKLITITEEGRRIYPIKLVVNSLKLNEVVIDPHYESKHSYMSDERIFEIVKFLNNKKFIPTNRKKQYLYFETDIDYDNRNHRLIWCLEDGKNYLGIIHCYYKKKHEPKK